jgi:hypothetical protein
MVGKSLKIQKLVCACVLLLFLSSYHARNTGRAYFCNVALQQTTWDRPTASQPPKLDDDASESDYYEVFFFFFCR